MRRALGTTVFSGMLGVTAFGVLLTPVFFFAIDWASERTRHAYPALHRVLDWSMALLRLQPLRAAGTWAVGATRPRRVLLHDGQYARRLFRAHHGDVAVGPRKE